MGPKCHRALNPPTPMTHRRPGTTRMPPASLNETCASMNKVLLSVDKNSHLVLVSMPRREEERHWWRRRRRKEDPHSVSRHSESLGVTVKGAGRARRGCREKKTCWRSSLAAWQTEEVLLITVPPQYGARNCHLEKERTGIQVARRTPDLCSERVGGGCCRVNSRSCCCGCRSLSL